jgi:branched-chain amino acid transport system ATP-binding protein
VEALRDVSIKVETGGLVAILGANGAGKSTLLKTVSGLLRARAGRIALQGDDITTSRAHERAEAGLCHIPEGRGIFRHLSVRENLMIQAHRGEEEEALERAGEVFPILKKRMAQRAGTLSGGEQQMLALSAAHIRRPSLIVVDEPSLGLAPIIVDEIFAFLKQLSQEGISILVVDQFAVRALEMASAAYVLRKGEITFEGVAEDLRDADLFAQYVGSVSEKS